MAQIPLLLSQLYGNFLSFYKLKLRINFPGELLLLWLLGSIMGNFTGTMQDSDSAYQKEVVLNNPGHRFHYL